MASVSKYNIGLGSLSGASGSADKVSLEQHTVDHVFAADVSALSGGTTLAFSIKTSIDGVSFAEIATGSATATGLKLITVPSPLSFVRVDWTLTGGVQTATVSGAICYDKRR
jgi:hypothetical protein